VPKGQVETGHASGHDLFHQVPNTLFGRVCMAIYKSRPDRQFVKTGVRIGFLQF